MSNSGDDQPLAPRRSLHKTPASVDGPTQPVLAPSYAGSTQQRPTQASSAPAGWQGAPTAAPPSAAQPDRSSAQPRASSAGASNRPRRVRRARLRFVRIDPWSVTKIAFLLSIAFGIMVVVAVFLVVSIMNESGLWDNVNESIQGVLNQEPADAFDITDYVALNKILGVTMLIAVLDVVLITALATLGAFLYNLAASLLGGVEVTLAEDQK